MFHRKLLVPVLVLSSIIGMAILSCSSVAGLPNPFATSTPTATATFTPTVTPSPTPTFTPTATPLPTGMAIQDLPGGSSRFYDYDGGYTIDIPADWLPIQMDPEDLQAAMSEFAGANPAIADAIKTLQNMPPGFFRIVAYDKQESHYTNGLVANFNVLILQDRISSSMPLNVLIRATFDQIKAQYPGAKVKQLETKPNAHGLPIGSSEIEMPLKLPSGKQITLYEKQLYFQTKKAFVAITFAAYKGNAQLILPSFDKLIDGIELMQP